MGKICFKSIYPPNANIEMHWTVNSTTGYHTHDYWEFFVVTEGKVKHNVNGKINEITANNVAFLDITSFHNVICDPSDGATFLNVSITDEFMHKVFELYGADPNYFFADKDGVVVVKLTENATKTLLSLVQDKEIFTRINKNTVVSQHVDCSKAYEMIILSNYVKYIFIQEMENTFNCPVWLNRLLIEINNPKNSRMKVEQVYVLSGYSKSHCIRLFKEFLNVTPIEYLINLKIKYACNLLDTSDCSILEISQNVGYDSLSHFNHIFLSKKGVSPSKYRKLNK